MATLESAMKASPRDVFWLQERWKVYVKRRRPFQQWLAPVVSAGNKPHRALIWLVDVSESWVLAEPWFHPDVIYEAAITDKTKPPEWLPDGTRIHVLPLSHSQDNNGSAIRSIESNEVLPYDFIITQTTSPTLTRAAAGELIPLVSLP
jgi:hypothetical protein